MTNESIGNEVINVFRKNKLSPKDSMVILAITTKLIRNQAKIFYEKKNNIEEYKEIDRLYKEILMEN